MPTIDLRKKQNRETQQETVRSVVYDILSDVPMNDHSSGAVHGKIRKAPPNSFSPPMYDETNFQEVRKFRFPWKSSIVIIVSIFLTVGAIRATDYAGVVASLGSSEGIASACPPGMVFILSSEGGFCIDAYESSPGSECPHIEPINQQDTQRNLDFPACVPESVAGKIPWRNISQNQAAVACAKAGKRLPTNKEWYQAALGTPDANDQETGSGCNIWNARRDAPDLTGARTLCVSSGGAYDMVGNVWEWIDGTVFDGAYKGKKLPSYGFVWGVDTDGIPVETRQDANPHFNKDYFWIDQSGSRGMFRGGYWGSETDAGYYAIYAEAPSSFAGTGVGFRCVQ